MSFRIQIRRGTSVEWQVENPILLDGEIAYETDTNISKIGNGVDPYNSLPNWPVLGPTGPILASDIVFNSDSGMVQNNISDALDYLYTLIQDNLIH